MQVNLVFDSLNTPPSQRVVQIIHFHYLCIKKEDLGRLIILKVQLSLQNGNESAIKTINTFFIYHLTT